MAKEDMARQLVYDFQQLLGADKRMRFGCDPYLYQTFECCKYHKELNARNMAQVLSARILTAGKMPATFIPFSVNWWRHFAELYPTVQVPNSLTELT